MSEDADPGCGRPCERALLRLLFEIAYLRSRVSRRPALLCEVCSASNPLILPRRGAPARCYRHRVRLQGDLVDIEGTGPREGFTWTTSLSRTDTDKGACETILLNEINVGGNVYR